MNPRSRGTFGAAAALGVVAGMRAFLPLATLGVVQRDGAPRRRARWRGPALVAAAVELVADKAPFMPSRLRPAGLLARVGSSGLAGARIARDAGGPGRRTPLAAAATGALAAVASAYVFHALRRRLATRQPDVRGAVLEDALAVALAVTTARRLQRPAPDLPRFPASFRAQRVASDDATLYVRHGGVGPAVVLLHGYTEAGDMWAPLAAALARTHTVIVPDLRGLGRSSHPAGGYDKKTQGRDVARVLDALGIARASVVGHDLGAMVAYAFAAQSPDRVDRLVLMDAPLPGVGPWDEILRRRALWHFGFSGPEAEGLVAGRERLYLDRLWNAFAEDPSKLTTALRDHYAALYAQPGAMHAGFAQFAAFDQDARDNQVFATGGPLTMPVLAVGGAASFGSLMATIASAVAAHVREVVIPHAGHWLMEEQPAATIAAVHGFLAGGRPS